MRRTKEQKGITLIALIITIVVLLILAVVAINSIQNDGIISKAEEAAKQYNQAVDDEKQQLQNYLDYLDKHNVGSKTYKAYTVGQEVIVKADVDEDGVEEDHAFYVIEASDATKETVLLLAKGNINTTTLKQESPNTIVFSSTNYWATIEGITYPYDLEEPENEMPEAGHYAARAAYDYGVKLLGKGRLMRRSEAIALIDNTDFSTKLSNATFWLAAADGETFAFCADDYGLGPSVHAQTYNSEGYCGVRPVIEISKSKIS